MTCYAMPSRLDSRHSTALQAVHGTVHLPGRTYLGPLYTPAA